MSSPLRNAVAHGFARGFQAARENLLPALLIQAIMVVVVLGYYLHWPTTVILDVLAAGKAKGGLWFSFLATGCCGGILSEFCLVYILQNGRWRRTNVGNLAFKFLLLGVSGVGSSLLYTGLARLLGNRNDWEIVAAKSLIDQLLYSAFLPIPLAAAAAHWKSHHYRASSLRDCLTLDFLGSQWIPLVVTNWGFWFPATLLIYALPLPLQIPLFLLAVTIWGLLLISVTARRHPELEAIQG